VSATLRLTRHAFASQKWPIVLDKTIVGSVGHGETVDLNIGPGHHTLHLGSKRHLSPERAFEVAGGKVINFRSRQVRAGRVHHCPYQTGLSDLAPPGAERGTRLRKSHTIKALLR
jgi:hypothetical protein